MDPTDMEVEDKHDVGGASDGFCPVSAASSFLVQALSPVTNSFTSINCQDASQQTTSVDSASNTCSQTNLCGSSNVCNPTSQRASVIPMAQVVGESCAQLSSGASTRGLSAPTPRGKRNLDSLGSELVCSICQQFFVEASTVECGHSFCRMCIESWLKTKLSCPVCRHPIEKPPIASVCLDKAVRAVLEITQEQDSVQDLLERKKQACLAREEECFAQSCLENLFQKALQQGVRVVHISKHWSPREQQRFLCGIERHKGVAREAYCKVVGLTYEWIGRATMDELLVAVTNVKLRDMENRPKPVSDWKESCILKLRSRLEMYIRYG